MTAEPIRAPTAVGRAIETPKVAAIAGVLFSVIFAVALVLLRTTVPASPDDAGEWLTDSSRRDARRIQLVVATPRWWRWLWAGQLDG